MPTPAGLAGADHAPTSAQMEHSTPVISVRLDDLAFVQADAIVRPADQTLAPVTPAMSRLDLQAGPGFTSLRRVSSPLEAGAAVVTGGGELAAPLVLHVVIQDAETSGDRAVVRRALVAAWHRAADWGLARIAAPLVGTGAGQLGIEEAATLLAETFPAGNVAPTCPNERQIVVERESERETVEAVLARRRS
jgi:O-acetyl-ADP-ribose deacetylase